MTVYTSHVVLFGKAHFLYILQLIRSNHLCADPDEQCLRFCLGFRHLEKGHEMNDERMV